MKLVNKIHLIESLNRRKQRSSDTKPGNGRCWKKTQHGICILEKR